MLAAADQPVSFTELFFDIVFVYAITQIVHLMHGEFDWVHVGRSMLVFWLVWWAWTQFTWALNAADTKNPWVQLAVLMATVIAFFMAVSVPESFGRSSWWFALAYVGGRSIGLITYLWVTWQDPEMRSAVKTFSTFSLAGLTAVLVGGYLGGVMQYWFWGFAILLDVIAALVGGRNDSWKLHAGHFSERHGLFIIIALGETLIIAASAVTQEFWNGELLIVSLLSVGITSCLWWLYFYRIKEILEHEMAWRKGIHRSEMARDVFSLLHFPILCGLIIYAFAIEEAMLHPDEAMSFAARIALSLGILVYSSGIVLALWRATSKFYYIRFVMSVLTAAGIAVLNDIQTIWAMGVAFTGLILLCVGEEMKTKAEEGI